VHQGLDICGLALHESGAFVFVNSRGVWIWDGKDDLQFVADGVEENEVCFE
jgi:hypothetical protein